MEFRSEETEKPRRRSRRRSNASALSWTNSENAPAFATYLTADGTTIGALINALLLLTLAATTLAMAGRTAVGQATFLIASLGTATVFFAAASVRGTRVRLTWIDVPIFAAVCLVVFQITPLPTETLAGISPAIESMFPLRGFGKSAVLPPWTTLSLAPRETFAQLGLLVAGWLLTMVVRSQIRSARIATGFLDLLTLGVTLLGMFGFVQFALGNGKFFWFFEHPYTTTNIEVKASFSNANHFGQLQALFLPWPVWRALTATAKTSGQDDPWKVPRFVGPACCVMVLLPAAVLSQSRNALATAGIALIATCIATWLLANAKRRGEIRRRVTAALIGASAVVALALVLVGQRFENGIEQGFAELVSGDAEQLDHAAARERIWTTVFRGSKEFPFVGVGLGAHGSTYQRYWEGEAVGSWFSHAESGPIQVFYETGRIGAGLLVAILGLVTWRLFGYVSNSEHKSRDRGVVLVVALVFLLNIVQSLADYSWYVPAIAMTVAAVVSAGLVTAGTRRSRYGARIVPIAGFGMTTAALLVFVAPSLRSAAAEPHVMANQRLSRSSKDSLTSDLFALRELVAAVRIDPLNPGANAALAKRYLKLFDLGQERFDGFPLQELRDIALSGGWTDQQELIDWLHDDAVAGRTIDMLESARHHAIVASRSRPADHRLTLILNRTCFLEDASHDAPEQYLAQLRALAPNDPGVLLEAASESARIGERDEAIALLKQAFAYGPRERNAILGSLTKLMTGEELLRDIELDGHQRRLAAIWYGKLKRDEDRDVLDLAAAEQFEREAQLDGTSNGQLSLLGQAAAAYQRVGNLDEALRLTELRVNLSPADLSIRAGVAAMYARAERWHDAAADYQWCLTQQPDHAGWQRQLERCQTELKKLSVAGDQSRPLSR